MACPLFLKQYADDFPTSVLEDNRAACPKTTELLSQFENLVVGGYMKLEAGAEIRRHQDHRDDNVIRTHLALRLPENEKEYWKEGTAKLMDIRMPHEASNGSEFDRLTLCCDFRLDFHLPDNVITPWGPPNQDQEPS